MTAAMAGCRSFALAGDGAPPRPPPPVARGAVGWLRRNLFASPFDAAVTLALAAAIAWFVPRAFAWALVDAVWWSPDGAACRAAAGACWAVVAEKHRLILFGTYPYGEQWRGAAVIAIFVAMIGLSAVGRIGMRAKLAAWVAAAAATLVLMLGGVFGLMPVGTHLWGGLPLTIVIFAATVAGGLPLAVLLALGRQSTMPAIRAVSVGVIEVVRGLPLIAVLFVASLVFPLFVPPELQVDKLVRAIIGMIVFFGAYAAEIVRGGLQAIPAGQHEAAKALGLGYGFRMRLVVLPQALALVVPALLNDIIRAFKNTTFVAILGLFDVLGAAKVALEDPVWVRHAPEVYVFVFVLYLLFCLAFSRQGMAVERRLAVRRR
ncbi:amino acid ABC transporter permease [Stella sp.]|uniref:amino acid ABC transporter permease n=1 Tax=Stella sp. TaxID=2912054 RepID=UPI0035ADD50F